MVKQLEQIYLCVCLGIITFGALLVGYWYYIPETIIKVEPIVVIDNKNPLHIGDQIQYTFKYCKYKDITARVDRALIDGTRITFTSIFSNLQLGCHTTTSTDLFVPNGANYGLNKIQITAHYQYNPLREQTVDLMTNSFYVVK